MSKRCMGCMEYYGDEFDICPHCGYIEGTPPEEAIHMEPGTLLHDRYIIGRVLGFGGFGVTYIGWDGKLEQKVAVKEYLPGEFSTRMPGQSTITVFNGEKGEQFRDGLEKFVDEAKRLARFQNEPGVVKIFDSFYENETAYIIMEYLDGETLTERLAREKTIPEDEAVDMLMPVMRSLEAVHGEGILHRDIAPDNIFFTKDGEVKLIDFGASRYATTSHSRSLTVIIKPGFSPEEQYRSRGDQGAYTDVYALAATLYKMITGKTPPDAMERRASIESKRRDLLIPPHALAKITRNRENAILNAMNVQIEDRTPDVRSFIEELNTDPPVKRRYGKIKRIDLYTWPKWLKILIPSVLTALIIVGVLLATGVINIGSLFSGEVVVPEGYVIVPDVEGMAKDEAIQAIEEMKLQVSAEGNVVSEYIQAGKIVLQSPNGGSYLEEYGTVVLTVSSGKDVEEAKNGKATVPYVVWDTQADAVEKLKKAGLAEPDIETKADDNVEAGRVISQSVDYGTEVEEGTKIKLVVSSGPAYFEMPDVTGMNASEAKNNLGSRGLAVETSYEESGSVAKDKVISQSVSAGTQVKKGDSVLLKVSSGSAASSRNEQSSVRNETPQTTQAKTITVTFDPNGGSVSPQYKTVTVMSGAVYGDLPTPVRSYCTFIGWYTKASGGSKVTSATSLQSESNHTLYAHWSQKPTSGWVPASQLPSGAKVVEIEWRYKETQTMTSGNSSESGWELYDRKTSYGSYGGWSGWSTNYVSGSDSRQVETRQYEWCRIEGNCCGNRQGYRCYLKYMQDGYTLRLHYDGWTLSREELNTWETVPEGSWYGYAPNVQGYVIGPGTGYVEPENHVIYFLMDSWNETQYRYRDRSVSTTYYYRRTVQRISSYDPSGQPGVSDVVKYVRYIEQ